MRRIPPPEPERPPCMLVLEELADVISILEKLSLSLARLEAQKAAPASRHDSGACE
jgi:hypothetical protein